MEPLLSTELSNLKANGDFAKRLEFARQIGNHRVDALRLRQTLARTARRYLETKGISTERMDALAPLPAPPPAWKGMPTTGDVNVFALLIEFPDVPHTNADATINDALFGNPVMGVPYESLTEYYRRSSYDLLKIGGATLGWYKAGKKRSQIATNQAGRESLIKEALLHFKAQGHNFQQYDNDHDGIIDYFLVFWSGPDTGWGTFWWGYMTGFADSSFTVDGVGLGTYSWQWESRPVGAAFKPRVAIHETGHALGLPDLYDYDPNVGPDGGVGGADMMDGNQFDHNCFSKWMLEWLQPTIITGGCQHITLAPTGNSPACVAVWPALEGQGMFSELFMVQNRQPVGNDQLLPGAGLMIWHVDASLDTTGNDFGYDNSWAAHKYIRLMEADGAEQIEANQPFDVNDLYTPGKSFGPSTTPSSTTYSGATSAVAVTNITTAGSMITADICATQTLPKIKAPAKVDFGWVKVGRIQKRQVKINNIGTAPLTCTITMEPGTDFELHFDGRGVGVCGSNTPSIPPGASCTFWVWFKPMVAFTARQGMLNITSNDTENALVKVLLRGVAW